jgi:hypothetical protein
MTTPSPDEQSTTVLPQQTLGQQTVEQPSVTTAPPTRRAGRWAHRLPARIGKARTSTLVIGCLFVLLFALNAALPRPDEATSPVVLPSGQTIQVRNSDLPDDYVPPTPTAPRTTAPATSVPPASTSASTTSRAPVPSEDEEETTPAPTTRAPSTSSAPTTSRAPATSRAPSSSSPPAATEESEESSSAPTS